METQRLTKCYENLNWSSCLLNRTVSSCVCKMSYSPSETTAIGIVVGKGHFMKFLPLVSIRHFNCFNFYDQSLLEEKITRTYRLKKKAIKSLITPNTLDSTAIWYLQTTFFSIPVEIFFLTEDVYYNFIT